MKSQGSPKLFCCLFRTGKNRRTTTTFAALIFSLINGDIYCSVQLVDLAVKLIQGAVGTLGVDRQRLRLQILVDLIQIFIDPTQLPFKRIQLGLAGDADPDILVSHPSIDLTRSILPSKIG